MNPESLYFLTLPNESLLIWHQLWMLVDVGSVINPIWLESIQLIIDQSTLTFNIFLIDTGKEGCKYPCISADDTHQLMMLLLLNHRALMAAPLRSIKRTLSSTCSALKWEGGVSMVQGASRGIGLEFVRIFSFSFHGFLFMIFSHWFPFLCSLVL